jgi:hypothetical protein
MERMVEALDARFARANADPAASSVGGVHKERG